MIMSFPRDVVPSVTCPPPPPPNPPRPTLLSTSSYTHAFKN